MALKGKALIRSKTFWFGLLVVVNAVAALFGFGVYEPSPELLKLVGLITGLGVILLRFKTSEPINGLK